jgi:4-hydroxy-L-threonine phosphate dehydrogenase PdxA
VTQSTIALTIGDPNGIGPEIAVKAAARLAREGGPAVVLVGDEFVVRFYADLCAKDLTIRSFDDGCWPSVRYRVKPSLRERLWPRAGGQPSTMSLRRYAS